MLSFAAERERLAKHFVERQRFLPGGEIGLAFAGLPHPLRIVQYVERLLTRSWFMWKVPSSNERVQAAARDAAVPCTYVILKSGFSLSDMIEKRSSWRARPAARSLEVVMKFWEDAQMIDTAALEADSVKTVDDFKKWTRAKIRPVFPHEALCSGYGHLHAGGVEPAYLVTVDAPAGYFEEALRNRVGAIDTPILRRWLAVREPQLFELQHPWPDVPSGWFENFRDHGLKNVAAHGVLDAEGCFGTYHCFYRIPDRLCSVHVEALKQLAPVMHEVLCRVVALLNSASEFAARLAALSRREKEIVQWVKLGKTNSEVANVSGLSENTVKHHLTNIFGKLAVETRAQLLHRLAEDQAKAAPASGPKIL